MRDILSCMADCFFHISGLGREFENGRAVGKNDVLKVRRVDIKMRLMCFHNCYRLTSQIRLVCKIGIFLGGSWLQWRMFFPKALNVLFSITKKWKRMKCKLQYNWQLACGVCIKVKLIEAFKKGNPIKMIALPFLYNCCVCRCDGLRKNRWTRCVFTSFAIYVDAAVLASFEENKFWWYFQISFHYYA